MDARDIIFTLNNAWIKLRLGDLASKRCKTTAKREQSIQNKHRRLFRLYYNTAPP